jgi:hypothetical protein
MILANASINIDQLLNKKIIRWYTTNSEHNTFLQITLEDEPRKEIRFIYPKLQIVGNDEPFFIEKLIVQEPFNETTRNSFNNNLGTLTALKFHTHNSRTANGTHENGNGIATISTNSGKNYLITCDRDKSFIKIM